MTVKELLDLSGNNTLKVNFYDEVHQINDSCIETDLYDNTVGQAYDWLNATIVYWYITDNELSFSCTLAATPTLQLMAIANAMLSVSESLSLVRDQACEKTPFENLLDDLDTIVNELKNRAATRIAEGKNSYHTVADWLLDIVEFINDIQIEAEVVRTVDAGIVNILDSECIEVLKLIRDFRRK